MVISYSNYVAFQLSFRFRVSSSLVEPFLEGMSLVAALEASRLFIVDYSIMEKADVDSERVVRQ